MEKDKHLGKHSTILGKRAFVCGRRRLNAGENWRYSCIMHTDAGGLEEFEVQKEALDAHAEALEEEG